MFTTSILRFLKKNQYLQKHFTYFQVLFKLLQILSPIQVFVSSFQKYDYNNLTFEVHANKS
jgi:hypothetical protein